MTRVVGGCQERGAIAVYGRRIRREAGDEAKKKKKVLKMRFR